MVKTLVLVLFKGCLDMSFFYRVVRNCSQSFTLQVRQAAISHYSNHYEVRDIVF